MTPEIDGGRFPCKRIAGDRLRVEADVFADGHDQVAAVILHRRAGKRSWTEVPLEPQVNDRWRGSFELEAVGVYEYTILAWVDPFLTWRRDLSKWIEAESDVSVELIEGAVLLEAAGARASAAGGAAAGSDADSLEGWSARLRKWSKSRKLKKDPSSLAEEGGPLDDELAALMWRWADRELATRYPRVLRAVVDREIARFSTWYEFFPRSAAEEPGRHGTFDDSERMLAYAADMGFDVVYLPPIHPIGTTHRKGPNNRTTSSPEDCGSPWAIGSEEGGHTAVHPELGTLEDFEAFRQAAQDRGLEVALDVAFQCSPDHPWVHEHPEWFRHRPDGSIRHAENPPKKYEDIYPIDFETEAWEELWEALRDVFTFWMDRGVRIFRVDNPHTKALPFWEWVIGELKRKDPGVVLLSEAFTRPKMMYRLAKLGFTQSYTYFAWRNGKHEIMRYMEELVRTEVSETFRPNFWPNTPDILTEFLQTGGRPAFMIRLVLAAGLSSSYGIYGPPFELLEWEPREPGSEEYLNSEKYQLRSWDLDRPDSLREFITRMNRIRKENAALQRNDTLAFHAADNDRILVWSKTDLSGENRIVVTASLDPHHVQSGWVELDHAALGMEPDESYQVEDLLAGGRYLWEPGRNFVRLDPEASPAHVFRVVRQRHHEEDFESF